MLTTFIKKISSLPVLAQCGGVVAAFVGFRLVKAKLDASYAASNHPVDYFTGQTAFSGAKIKEYYAHMIEAGTLDVYWQTQIIDFGFMAAIFALGLFLGALLIKLARPNSWAGKFGFGVAIFAMIGACCDALENLVSFVMLANPTGFADWIALPYSSFAVVKFGFMTLAMLSVLVALALMGVGRVFGRATLG